MYFDFGPIAKIPSEIKLPLAWPQWWSFEDRFLLRTQTCRQKVGIIFENKVFQEINLSKNVNNSQPSPKLISNKKTKMY